MPTFNSPSVKTSIVDYSGYVSTSSSTVLALIGGASMGPINTPTLITSEAQFVRTFGAPALTNYGQAAAIQFLKQGNQLYYVRVTDATDKQAAIQIPSTVATPTNSFTAMGAYTGAGYNGYQVVVSNVNSTATPATFTLTILDPNGRSVAVFNGANLTSGNANYLPTLVNGANLPVTVVDPNNGTGSIPTAGTYTLAGGSNGDASLTGTQVIGTGNSGMQAFTNSDLYPINILATPGFTDSSVIQAGISLCSTRGDCIFLVDTPQSLSVSEVVDWSNGTGTYSATMTAIDSPYAAVYWPWVQSFDPYNGVNRWTPPSGWIAGVYAFNDQQGYPWTAPAGLNRGKLTLPIGIEYSASQAERDTLQGNGNIINPIVNFTNIGLVVWGQATASRANSDLNRVNVVRLLGVIRKAVQASSLYLTFEANNEFLWNEWLGMVTPYLSQIQNEGGFYGFQAVMDSSIVTDTDIQTHYLPGKISIQPTLDAEFIDIGFILLPTGAKFS